MRTLVADPQYSSRRFREKVAGYGVESVIPYPRAAQIRPDTVDKLFLKTCEVESPNYA